MCRQRFPIEALLPVLQFAFFIYHCDSSEKGLEGQTLLQHLPPGYKHCQINLREQLISEYASWCGMTSTSKRPGSPSHTPILPYSGCNLAIPMTSNDIHPMKAANLKSNDYYEVLGVPRTANESEITKVASRFFDLRIMLCPVSSNIPTFAGEDINI